MAKGVYSKKRPTAKKVSSFDTKIIIIVSVAILALVIGVVALILIDTASKAYVGKVDGIKVSAVDYRIFLSQAKAEMEAEYAEENDLDSVDAATFWTAENIKKAEDKAIDNVREFYAEYSLAKSKGHEITKDERTSLSNSVNSMILTYSQYYSMSYDELLAYTLYSYTGYRCESLKYEEDFDKCVDFLGKQLTINNLRVAMQDGYKLEDLKFIDSDTEEVLSTGEPAIKAAYEDNRDAYRRITLQVLALKKDGVDLPTEPEPVAEPAEPENKDKDSAEYTEYMTKKAAYAEYLTALETYQNNMKSYEELKAKVKAIFDALSTDGKYTGKGLKDQEYTDATLADIVGKEGVEYNSSMKDDGTCTYTGTPSATDLLAVFANSIEWTDEQRLAVKSTLVEKWADDGEETDAGKEAENAEGGEETADSEEKTDEDEEDTIANIWSKYSNDYTLTSVVENSKFKESGLILIEDGSNFYIVKVTAILDLDTSTEDAPEDDDGTTELSVRATVLNTLKNMTSYVNLKDEVKAAGAKFDFTDRKDGNITTASNTVFGSKS